MDTFLEAKITDINASHLGIDLFDFFDKTGQKISERLIDTYGKEKNYVFICGLGGNAGDGFAAAYYLIKKGAKNVQVYLGGRPKGLLHPTSLRLWKILYELAKNRTNLSIKQDCYANDIKQGDVLVECLVGTGLVGSKLNKRFYDIIKRVSHFTCPKAAIDVPTPHYTPDTVFSINYPKAANAEVIRLKLPQQLKMYCGPGEVEMLVKPKKKSHKNKNGNLLSIGNFGKKVGLIKDIADSYAVKLKIFKPFSEVAQDENFVNINEIEFFLHSADAILIGNIGLNYVSKAFLSYLISEFSDKKFIFYGSSLEALDEELFAAMAQCVIVCDRVTSASFLKAFGSANGKKTASFKALSKKLGFNAFLIGSQSVLYSSDGDFRLGKMPLVYGANGAEKIAFLAASYATLNDPWLALRSAAYVLSSSYQN